jgi:SlyX protein
MDEERLVRIETKLSYQEATIADLGEALLDHSDRIAALEALVKALREKVKELGGEGQLPLPVGERPPHY